jgi:hypothetical protein
MLKNFSDYHTDLQKYTGNSAPVAGQYLARADLTFHEQAFVGRDLWVEAKHLVAPTQEQAAFLAGCSVAADRDAILAGILPLVPPQHVQQTERDHVVRPRDRNRRRRTYAHREPRGSGSHARGRDRSRSLSNHRPIGANAGRPKFLGGQRHDQ